MAPKRKEVCSSSVYDSTKFISAKVEQFYHKVIAKASYCRDRGVEYSDKHFQYSPMDFWFGEVIRKRQWEELCAPLEEGCMNLVREFYANCKLEVSDTRTEPTYKSWFRGTPIDYSPGVIRSLLELPTEEEVLEKFGANGPDYHTLLNEFPAEGLFESIIGRPDADWLRKEKKAIKRVDVKPRARVWAFFVSDSLLPTLSKSELRKEMLTFIYCLLEEFPIDLARVISWRIHETANGNRGDHCLGYPLLINKLVKAKLGTRTPRIESPIEPVQSLSSQLLKSMIADQEDILSKPREPRASKATKKSRGASSSTAPPSDSEEPPAWAVQMQNEMRLIGGSVLNRMDRLHSDVAVLWEASQYQDSRFMGNTLPYSALEMEMMSMSLAAGQPNQESLGGDDQDETMT